MNVYFFTIIIVTNPQCQITQQSCIDNCRQVGKVSYIFIQNKNENDKTMLVWQNLFHFFSRVISGKKDLNFQDRTVQR